MKKILLTLLILGLLQGIYALGTDNFANNIFYKGDISFELDKKTYKAGDELKTEITVANMEDFPIVDAYLVVEMVKGGTEHVYPSQLSDEDNVFYEEIIGNINLAPRSQKKIPFSYKIPTDMKSGNCRLEVYFRTKRTPIVGIPHIFMSPKYQNFKVEGMGNFPYASIVRTKTTFANEVGPIGVGVDAGSNINGKIYVQSASPSRLDDLSLKVIICEWDDTSCTEEEYLWSKEYEIPSLDPNGIEKIDVEFNAPNDPEAYAIRLELNDKNGRIISLYRSRIIVKGETGRIRKMAINKLYFKKDERGEIGLLIAPSPDHYTYPVVRNAKLSVSVKERDKEVYSKSIVIPELSIDEGFISEKFEFIAPHELSEFEVCSKIESESGKLYDQYCYSINPPKIMLTKNIINAEWDYDYHKNLLHVNLCVEDASGRSTTTKATAILSSPDNKQIIGIRENLELYPCQKTSFNTDVGGYNLLVNDLKQNKQFRFNIIIEPKEISLPICGNNRCEEGENSENCCIDCGCPEGKECVDNVCQKIIEPSVCGNNRCEEGENSENCCIDCGCPEGKECVDNVCRVKEIPKPSVTKWYPIAFIVLILMILIILAAFYSIKRKRSQKPKT